MDVAYLTARLHRRTAHISATLVSLPYHGLNIFLEVT